MNHLQRSWNSLSDLRDYLVKNKLEKVKYFDGWQLVTDKRQYQLVFGQLSFQDNKATKRG